MHEQRERILIEQRRREQNILLLRFLLLIPNTFLLGFFFFPLYFPLFFLRHIFPLFMTVQLSFLLLVSFCSMLNFSKNEIFFLNEDISFWNKENSISMVHTLKSLWYSYDIHHCTWTFLYLDKGIHSVFYFWYNAYNILSGRSHFSKEILNVE